MELIIAPHRHTYRLGGVDVPAAAVLEEMHAGQYILRAVGGQLIQVAVEKVLLPHSNNTSPQAVQVDRGAGGLVTCGNPRCCASPRTEDAPGRPGRWRASRKIRILAGSC